MNEYPPPPKPESESEGPTPKKAWVKPTIRRLEDGVVVTESGPNFDPGTPEGPTYRPTS